MINEYKDDFLEMGEARTMRKRESNLMFPEGAGLNDA